MSLDNRPYLHWRLPVRRGALPRRGQALGDAFRLPLPHVPEGVRHFLRRLVSVRDGQARLDPRRTQLCRRPTTCGRGFCADCGTPLTFEAPDGLALAIGAFDDPADIAPPIQWGSRPSCPMSTRSRACRARRRSATSTAPPTLPISSPTSIPTTTPKPGRRSVRTSYDELIAHALSGDRTVRHRHARCRRRPHVYWERCRHPGAKPAVFLHGGPGGGISPNHRRLFDPGALRRRAVRPARLRQVDARMPRSRPTRPGIWSPTSSGCARWPGSTRWLVFGGSWGSTLALAYAETHPERVSELVLRGIFTLRRCGARMVLSARRLADASRTSGSASSRRSRRPSAAT